MIPTVSSWGMLRETIEQAKEELQILEAQYPNGFSYLKHELNSFISFLESQNQNSPPKMLAWAAVSSSVSISPSAATEESSTSKKRKKVESGGNVEALKQKLQRVDRTDAVFKRAQACLERINHFKTTFT